MKKLILLFNLIFVINYSYSQVNGLSASKLATLCTETVPAQTIEFEPFFGFASSASFFDSENNVQNLFLSDDSTQFFSSTGFRFSYGLMDNLEIGVSLPVDVSSVGFGGKYKFPTKGDLSLGLLAGYNAIIGNNIYVRRNSVLESTSALVGGLIITYKFSDKLSADFNFQYQTHLNSTTEGHKRGLFLSSDIGYYLVENVNFILGMNYFYKDLNSSENSSQLFTLNPGIAIEKSKNFILVLNSPLDLFGKNEYKSAGFGLALTIIIN